MGSVKLGVGLGIEGGKVGLRESLAPYTSVSCGFLYLLYSLALRTLRDHRIPPAGRNSSKVPLG